MRSLRGKFFNSLSYLKEQSHDVNGSVFPILLKFQLFSFMDGGSGSVGANEQFRCFRDYGRKNDNYDDDNDDEDDDYNDNKFSGKKDGDFSAPQKNLRSLRGERQQMPQFKGGRNDVSDRNYRWQGRNDGFRNPFVGDASEARFDDVNEGSRGGDVGLGRDKEGRKNLNPNTNPNLNMNMNLQPSVSELLNKPVGSEERGGKEGSDFLDKFKLGGVSKGEEKLGEEGSEVPPPQEEKMEAPKNADEIFKKMKQTGLIPNAVAMLDGLCKDGLVQEALKLFGLMREKGSMPEVVVYTAVVEGFCQAQSFDDAKRIFRKMQNNGIVPNAFSYTVLIKGLFKAKKLDEAVDFCVEMLENGHSPNVTTFTGLVHEFCKEKGVEEARKVIVTLRQKGFLLDEKAVRTYLDKNGPTSPMVWEAIFGPKKTAQRPI